MRATKRCYCLLSHHPFFELHFDVIQHVLAQERCRTRAPPCIPDSLALALALALALTLILTTRVARLQHMLCAAGEEGAGGAADVIQVLDAFLQA